jgi:hypothetical protein
MAWCRTGRWGGTSSTKEEARDEDLSQSHGAKLGIEAKSTSRKTDHCGEHSEDKQIRRHDVLKIFNCQWNEHCGEHRVNKQSRRADATETFPITSYKVDMKNKMPHPSQTGLWVLEQVLPTLQQLYLDNTSLIGFSSSD